MNSLVSTLRNALRPAAARAAVALPARSSSWSAALYSTAAPSSSSSSSSTPDQAPTPRASSSSGVAALDSVISGLKQSKASSSSASQPQKQPQPLSSRGSGSAHAAAARHLFQSSPSARSASPFSSPTTRVATPEETWRHTPPVPYSLPVTTTSARSFAVRDGNVARAYRNLQRVLNENNIRRELKRQERFESPSNRRVRLGSERHRRRFKVAVGKAVALALRTKDL